MFLYVPRFITNLFPCECFLFFDIFWTTTNIYNNEKNVPVTDFRVFFKGGKMAKAQNVKINKHAKLIRCLIEGVSLSFFVYFKLKLRTKKVQA